PTALATDRLFELKDELVAKVRVAASAHPHLERNGDGLGAEPAPRRIPPALVASGRTGIVVVGTSTGGPQALMRLLTAVPEGFPVPLCIALHIPPGYTGSLARRLDEASALEVVEAENGIELRPGLAVLARGGIHLKLARKGGQVVAQLDSSPSMAFHPSVN